MIKKSLSHFFSGTTYYLDKRCSGGSKITDTTKCMEACNKLGISLSGNPFRNGRPCYQGGRGVCNQNGKWGSKSTMVCVRSGNLPSMYPFFNNYTYRCHLCEEARKHWKNIPLWILDLDTEYFIEDVGQKSCQNGTKIMNAQDCTTACNTLTTKIGRMKDGKPCYIAGNGNCRQAGRGGKKSSLVCMQKGNLGILLGDNTNTNISLEMT